MGQGGTRVRLCLPATAIKHLHPPRYVPRQTCCKRIYCRPLSKSDIEVIATNYIFDFGDYGLSDGYGTGRARNVSGDLDIRTNFFPMITKFAVNDISMKFFGGDTATEKWRRRFRLDDTNNISIKPIVHLTKVVTLEPPVKTDNWMAIYPDGSRSEIPRIDPDYDKLLSMK